MPLTAIPPRSGVAISNHFSIIDFSIRYQQETSTLLNLVGVCCDFTGVGLFRKKKFMTAVLEVARRKSFMDASIGVGLSNAGKQYLLVVLAGDAKGGSSAQVAAALQKKVRVLADSHFINQVDGRQHDSLLLNIPFKKNNTQTATIERLRAQIEGKLKSLPLHQLKSRNDKLTEAFKIIKSKEKDLNRLNDKLKASIGQLKTKNEELESFAHLVAHDLKSPLNAIFLSADMAISLYEEDLTDEVKELVEMIMTAGQSMKGIINDYLEYALSSAHVDNRQQLVLQEHLCELLDYLKSDKKIAIEIGQLPVVDYDPVAIEKVILNLVSNAIKYNDKEQVRLEISATEEEGEHVIVVKDNGPGIEEKYHELIFNPYTSVGKTRNEEKGTGLGLPLIRKIVERNHGKVWLESEMGKGSTFFFSIPKSDQEGF